ncbi:MAG: hypothetical protein ACI4ES_10810 [Roseburia sp.]
MAKYIAHPTKTKEYETNYALPFINAIAGMVWSVPILQNLLPDVDGIVALGIGAIITILYVVLSVKPIIAIVPCIASVIMYTAMLWGVADNIGHIVIRVIVKIVILLFVVFAEFSIFVNATLRWLQRKYPKKPRVAVVKEE